SAAAAAFHREAQAEQHRVEVDRGLLEGFGRREAGGQAVFLAGLERDDLDLRVERLSERGQHGQLAEPGRMGGERRARKRDGKQCDGDRSKQDSPAPLYSQPGPSNITSGPYAGKSRI